MYKTILDVYEKTCHKSIDTFMWDEYARIKKKEYEALTEIERSFFSKFWSWDKGGLF